MNEEPTILGWRTAGMDATQHHFVCHRPGIAIAACGVIEALPRLTVDEHAKPCRHCKSQLVSFDQLA